MEILIANGSHFTLSVVVSDFVCSWPGEETATSATHTQFIYSSRFALKAPPKNN